MRFLEISLVSILLFLDGTHERVSCKLRVPAAFVVPKLAEECSALLCVAVRQKDSFAGLFLWRLLNNFLFTFVFGHCKLYY